MKIFLYYVGRPKDRHANAIAEDYVGRICHYAPALMQEIRLDKTGLRRKHPSAHKIFLDPGGRQLDSRAFARLIESAETAGRDLVFLVGGADGLPAASRGDADVLLSLSAMTFPHELARVMLAEQIYRAFAILRGHPYPR